jgi:hypothetical protein
MCVPETAYINSIPSGCIYKAISVSEIWNEIEEREW